MNFSELPPPRRLLLPGPSTPPAGIAAVDAAERPTVLSAEPPRRPSQLNSGRAMPRARLAAPEDTDFPRRHLLDPRDGWFRRLERETNKLLSRHVYPKIPGLRRPYARILERSLAVSEGRVLLPGLGSSHAGFRLLLLSDVHAGPFVTAATLGRAFERLMSLEPDLVLVAGDFATVSVEEVETALSAFARLRAPLGVFGVLGNHDYYTDDPEGLCRLLEGAGIEFLHNRGTTVERDGAQMYLAGVDDLLCGRPRLDRALEARPAGVPSVVMSHHPDLFLEAVERQVDLVLAGHTHGGQIRFPGLPVLVRMSRYRLDEGRYQAGDSQLVVTRGLGATGLPIRLGCPPEAVLLTLRSAPV